MLIFQGNGKGVVRKGNRWERWSGLAFLGAQQDLLRRVRGFKSGWVGNYIHWCHSHGAWGQGRVLAEQGFAGKAKCWAGNVGATAAGRILRAYAGANSISLNVPKRWMVWGRVWIVLWAVTTLYADFMRYAYSNVHLYWLHTPPDKPYVLVGMLGTPMLCFSDSLWQSGFGSCKTSLPGLLFPL